MFTFVSDERHYVFGETKVAPLLADEAQPQPGSHVSPLETNVLCCVLI